MEYFNKAKTVRLRSHLEKYLTADDDQQTVVQSPNGSSRKARWEVEFVQGNPHAIRLKGCHGAYLTASDDSFLLGWTGKKVLQSIPDAKKDGSIEWEPIQEGYKVKLRSKVGKFLRANGATIPWRNSITHDLPHRTATQDWIFWDVDTVDVSVLDNQYLPNIANAKSLPSPNDHFSGFNSPTNQSMSHSRSPSIASANGNYSGSNSPATNQAMSHSRSSSIASANDDYSGSNSPTINPAENRATSMVPHRQLPSSNASQNRWPSIASNRSSINSGRQDNGMEFFHKAKAVRLQSYSGKYLVADEDEETVRQSRNGSSNRARWTVEFIDTNPNKIRLKSCHGLYLTATEEAFLLGMTGKKVLQTLPTKLTDTSIEWAPVKEGLNVKLMTIEGKFLRANGGTPPWRNSVTHDVPHRTATQSWILWGVDVVDISITDMDPDSDLLSLSSSNSISYDYSDSPETGSPVDRSISANVGSPVGRDMDNKITVRSGLTGSFLMRRSNKYGNLSMKEVSGMEFFKKAKTVRLKSHHDKYLTADSDEEKVVQDRSGTAKQARWTVEFAERANNVVRFKSCYGKYLTATDDEFLLGVTGRKVLQTMPKKLDSKVEWEPLRDGMQLKLKTRYGNYLRANGGVPPWRNSVTHDIPSRHLDWILWSIDVVEILPESPVKVSSSDSLELDEDFSASPLHPQLCTQQSGGSFADSPRKAEGRLIYYHVADDNGNFNDAIEGHSFQFKGLSLEQLSQRLEEETGLEDIFVCSSNSINGKLYPLRLALPPNNATMHVVVVPSTSRAAKDFMPKTPPA